VSTGSGGGGAASAASDRPGTAVIAGAVVGVIIGIALILAVGTCIIQRFKLGNAGYATQGGRVRLPQDVTVVTLSQLGDAYSAAAAAKEADEARGARVLLASGSSPADARRLRVHAAMGGSPESADPSI
jgi:hypothetical protein